MVDKADKEVDLQDVDESQRHFEDSVSFVALHASLGFSGDVDTVRVRTDLFRKQNFRKRLKILTFYNSEVRKELKSLNPINLV